MTDLERRALLGDRQAQEECTRQGIVLACPMCGKKEVLTLHSNGKVYHNYTIECAFNGRFVRIKDWNTRPVPPIGRCKDCQYSGERDENGYSICQSTGSGVAKTDFCSEFQPKGK
ncbi:hypothetical protein INF35_05770 [Subdoligranulum sp. DSM 109015]|uniref:Uncharacterized protein n=1 Tax=Gemmiger gallinarum TaxID=2779354 RepID=A0ABR9R2E8_9FIRM|nr:hypothetical protein [Gemmiger gallinarum]MBE5037284.1 hypothetical protein [Gemmiger gallinarum]